MIGLFNDCFPPIMDGVSLTTQNYAYWLNKKTHNICVVTPKSPLADDNDSYPIYRYSSFPIPMRKPYRLGFPRIDWPFHTKINKLSFELVHAHCPFSSGGLAMRIARSQRIPVVATFHSKYKADFERAIPNKIIVNYLIKRIIQFYEQADEVWIPQRSVEETLREYGYRGKVEVVDNGSDFSGGDINPEIKKEHKRRMGMKEHEMLLLFVGQHIWEKNTALILKSLSKIKEKPFRMLFVGSGYAENEMKRMAVNLQLTDKITFAGSITDRNLLKEYYTAADLFLFPSLYDNAPLVVREAAALHTPSVLIKDSTASEIILNGINGFLTENSEKEFASCIFTLMNDPGKVNKAGKAAAETIARSWESVADEVYNRYMSLIHRKNK